MTAGGNEHTVSPRWHRCVTLNAQAAQVAQSGDFRTAAALFDEAYAETLRADGDVEALICRSAVVGNRAGLAAMMGDFDEALRASTETITLATQIESMVGNAYGTIADRVNALITRAQYLRYRARFAEALDDLDAAFSALDSVTVNRELITVSLHTVRASVLVAAGRFTEGAVEARATLELAHEFAPHMAPYAHMTLAEIAGSTGDNTTSADHFFLARELFAAIGDANGQATAALSLARLAYLDSRFDDADELYSEAEKLFELLGNNLQLVTCRHGRAAVAVSRGRPAEALVLLDQVLDSLGSEAAPVALIATYQVQGSALETMDDFAGAEVCYRKARELSEQSGQWHATLVMDWWRAEAFARWAATVHSDEERHALRRQALDLALPAALAAEAARQRFSPGPMRERWIALAAAPATRAALMAIASLGDIELASAYIDHSAGTVSLRAESAQSVHSGPSARDEVLTIVPAEFSGPTTTEDDEVSHLPFAASAIAGGAESWTGSAGFVLPPRVRVHPETPSPLDNWIDITEERYGFPVRSKEVVRSW